MEKGWRLNVGYFMARHFSHVARQPKGVISVGGLITAITQELAYSFQLNFLSPTQGKAWIDLSTLEQMGVCALGSDGYHLLGPDGTPLTEP